MDLAGLANNLIALSNNLIVLESIVKDCMIKKAMHGK